MSAPGRAEIVEALLRFFREAYPDRRDRIHPRTPLVTELFVDSFGVIETVLFVEQRFGLDLLASGVAPSAFDSVEALAAVVEHALASPPGQG